MTVLPDHRISYLGCDLIKPFDEDQVQPASYDVRLGDTFRVFDLNDIEAIDLSDPSTFENLTNTRKLGSKDKFVLHPGEFALAQTEEAVSIPDNMVGRIEGKSSLGRLGLIVHATAGYLDPGFNGRITLEMTNLVRVPIILRPGIMIAQLSFQYLESACAHPYEGRYQGDMEVTPSRYGLQKEMV